jgi:hypothetical protein
MSIGILGAGAQVTIAAISLAAESMASQPYYCGAVAFTGVVDLLAGECAHSDIIMSFGDATAHEQWASRQAY